MKQVWFGIVRRVPSTAVLLLTCAASVLGSASSARADYTASHRWFAAKSEGDRLSLQMMLVLVGDYSGLIDGKFGKNTYQAIIEFEASQQLDGDGVLTPADE